jgi:DNA-3-methyladenine glycosylase
MRTNRRAAKVLPASFFARPAEVVGRELLGSVIVSSIGGTVTTGRVVETEAYLGGPDPASHGFELRRTIRNESLFGPPGLWYVYLSYGIHWCANLVCRSMGGGSAVLLRALEPIDGIDTMRDRRGVKGDRLLCSGPGRLCQALGITRSLDGQAMTRSDVKVFEPRLSDDEMIAITPRIGITKAVDWPLRFVLAHSAHLSKRYVQKS